MSFWDDWFHRGRRPRRFSFFEDFDRFFEESMKGFFEDLPEELYREETLPDGSKRKTFGPFVYGYSMNVGPDGKPQIREFGNVRPGLLGKPKASSKREPLIDMIEGDETIQVVAELPGVEKEDIDLQISSDTLGISVDSKRYKYDKTLSLPAEVDRESVKASYKNGVLQVTLKKLKKKPPTRKTIRIE
ncbi:MAG: archaeal heat shock protein Hsp20 [Candidatus Geothermarchaeales archaeon]